MSSITIPVTATPTPKKPMKMALLCQVLGRGSQIVDIQFSSELSDTEETAAEAMVETLKQYDKKKKFVLVVLPIESALVLNGLRE